MALRMFEHLRQGLAKTRARFASALGGPQASRRNVDEEFLENLEAALVASDLGPRLSLELVDEVRDRHRKREVRTREQAISFVRESLVERLEAGGTELARATESPTVYLLIGVNGTGKTTTAAKLAHRFKSEGRKVLLAAGDTFRAAAGEQLALWAERVGVDLVRHREGTDPGAVVFDACQAARTRGMDDLLVDTAGRLHTKQNLMRELEKIRRVVAKQILGAPHEALLIVDATTGQNALSQAQTFAQGVGLTGLVLAKIDGTAKGGIAIAINREVNLPIKLVGVGEQAEDLASFDPRAFVAAMFEDLTKSDEETPGGPQVAPNPDQEEQE